MKQRFHPARSGRRGFTLAEMMVVIVIIGLLATLVVPNVLKRFSFAQGEKAKVDITAIEAALTEYNVNNGSKWPDSLEALVTPDVNGYTFLKGTKLPKDPWGNDYLYDPPKSEGDRPIVYSFGKDGRRGGRGDDADIDRLSVRFGD